MPRLLLLFLLVTFTAMAQPQVSSNTTVSKQNKQVQSMIKIRDDYALFIDTRPSKKKRELAMKLKQEIETFQADYPNEPQLPAVYRLLEEVDIYLDTK